MNRTITLGTAAAAAALVLAPATVALAGGDGTPSSPWEPMKKATVVCQTATRFGNYTDGSHNLKDPLPASDYGTLTYGTEVQGRWESSDNYAVMTFYSPANTRWAFVLRSCLQFHG